MRNRKGSNSLLQLLKDDNTSTNDTIDLLRRLDRARVPGSLQPTSVLSLRRFGRATWRELGYLGQLVRKALLIVAFNVIGAFLLLWLLSLL